MSTVKREAIRLNSSPPDDSSWEDMVYETYVMEKIEGGLKALEQGKTRYHEEVGKRLAG